MTTARVPAWMEAYRDVAGPFLEAATAFADWKGPTPFPPGRDGMRRLGHLVEAMVFDVEVAADDEDRFLEGAGAMLAMLLLAHVGRGRHVRLEARHGLALGAFGYVDPCAAIDASLDARKPTAELARWVRLAEDEASGVGPVARVRQAFDEALAARGAPRVRDGVGLRLVLDDGAELDLGELARLADEPDALASATAKLAARLARASAGRDGRAELETEADVVLRICGRAALATLEARTGRPLATRDEADGLLAVLAVAEPGRLRLVTQDELTGLDAESLFARARAALDARVAAATVRPVEFAGLPALELTRGDGLAASALLAPGLRARLCAALGGRCVVAVPHRDRLLAFREDTARAVLAGLIAAVADEADRAPHAVARTPYLVDESTLRPLEPSP